MVQDLNLEKAVTVARQSKAVQQQQDETQVLLAMFISPKTC